MDVLGGKKVSEFTEIERSRRLCAALCGNLMAQVHPNVLAADTTIVIEHQPPRFGALGSNNVVSVAAHQILFRYCQSQNNNPIVYIDPKCKNQISIGDITFSKFLEESGCKRKYSARKKHSKALFMEICKGLGINISGITVKNLPDLADSFMGIFAHCLKAKILNLAPLADSKPQIHALINDINMLLERIKAPFRA
jgi:hypothetical protein